jgi:DNA polymerase-3 subunit alpha
MLLCRAYTHYSLLKAVPKVKTLLTEAKDRGYTVVAITDYDSGSGLVDFYDTAQKIGVQPLLGATLYHQDFIKDGFSKSYSRVAFFAKNVFGYIQLLNLISVARTQREEPVYHILSEDLQVDNKVASGFQEILDIFERELV